tara:strand:- start:1043 stop:2059 length:1017 start_codon:yes stop_codon:yes gene_type:complete
MNLWLKSLRRIAYWVLPIVLLLIIFHYIDLTQLKHNLLTTNPWILALGLFVYPITTIIGAVRWNILLSPYNRFDIPLLYTVRHYWIGMATGYFTPGSIGMDIYRVIVIGRKFGNYVLNMAVVLIEKFAALFTCMGLIIILYPFIVPLSSAKMIAEIITFAYIAFITVILIIALILLAHHNNWMQQIAIDVEKLVARKLQSAANRFGFLGPGESISISFRAMIEPVTRPYRLSMLVLLSLAIQIASAIGNHLLFVAVGYDIDFSINLFLSPVFFFIFLMPISVAGLGVREASFIVLYGLFGVPSETALLVSFYSMAGVLLTNSIGALFIYQTRKTVTSV